jgi:hypothetical protein
MRDLHRVIDSEFFRKFWEDFLDVLFFEIHRKELERRIIRVI